MKIKFLATTFLLLLLSNCASSFNMKKENFTSLEKEKKIAAFKMKITYEGKEMSPTPLKDWKSYCRLYFSKDGNFFSKEFYPYKTSGEYVFVTTDNSDLYLTGMECLDYRVFYNKIRYKKIGTKIFSFSDNDKINYGGDLEIEWTPEIFKATDLLLLGHLGVDDKGSFTMRLTENYDKYLQFMKNSYGFEEEKSVNATDKLLLKEPVIKLENEN